MQNPRAAVTPIPPQFNENVKPVPASVIGGAGPMFSPRPGTPGFNKFIPAPAPDPEEKPVAAPAPPQPINGIVPMAAEAAPDRTMHQRMVISFGPSPETLVVGIETYPDWDVQESYTVPRQSLRDMLPILKELVRIKNLTGGRLE